MYLQVTHQYNHGQQSHMASTCPCHRHARRSLVPRFITIIIIIRHSYCLSVWYLPYYYIHVDEGALSYAYWNPLD